ncbi:HEAT repeat domain-containing protein [Bacillus tuaregi]|uniref:HEAT repeat domain-containing protein n=1 Tax=Bacillus tuaregi TaxID=1816695 RepID=UPI0008F8DAF3|nr:HEAT repeat domain-containing protein [Bacillus tuaregi]
MDSYIEQILSTNMGTRKEAIKGIVEDPNNKQFIDELKKILETGPTYAKLDALSAYGRIIDKEDIDYLLTFLKHRDWHMRIEAIRCLCSLLGEDAIELITPFLEDKAYGVRSEVQELINKYQKSL